MKTAGGMRLALAKPADITLLEGVWPGGAIGLWHVANMTLAKLAVSSIDPWGDGSFAIAVPKQDTAAYPEAPAGLLLVQGIFTDPDKAAAYNMALPPLYKKFGGFYLSLSRREGIAHLAGQWEPTAIVIAVFDSVAAIEAFWYSDEYKAAKAVRAGGGAFLVTAFSNS